MVADQVYISSEVTGSAADPNTGVLKICGADTAFMAGSVPADNSNAGSITDPFKSFNPFSPLNNLTVDTDIYACGRFRQADAEAYLAKFDADVTGGVAIRILQWPGQPPLEFRGNNMPGGATEPDTATALANNKTIGGSYWQASGNGWYIDCDGTDGKADLTTFTALSSVCFDLDKPANIEQSNATSIGAYNAFLEEYPHDGVSDASTIATLLALTPAANRGKFFLGGGTGPGTHLLAGRLVVLLPIIGGVQQTPANAAANAVEYCVKARTLVSFMSETGSVRHEGCEVQDARFQMNTDVSAEAPLGAMLNFLNSTACGHRRCSFFNAGDHCWAFGDHVEDPIAEDSYINGAATGSYYCVFNASGPGNSAIGCGANGQAWLHSLLGHNGVSVDRSIGGVFAYVHGPQTGAAAVVWHDWTLNYHIPPSGAPDNIRDFLGADSVTPSDDDDASTMQVIVRDSRVNNGAFQADQGVTTYMGWINNRLDYGRQNSLSNGFAVEGMSMIGHHRYEGNDIIVDLTNGNGATRCGFFRGGARFKRSGAQNSYYDKAAAHATGKTYALDSLLGSPKTIDQITAHATTPVIRTTGLHGYTAGSRVLMAGTNYASINGNRVIATTPDTTHYTLVGSYDTTAALAAGGTSTGLGTVKDDGSALAFEDPTTGTIQVVTGDAGESAAVLDYGNLLYAGVGTNNVADDPSRNTDAEWKATVDAGALVKSKPFIAGTSLVLTRLAHGFRVHTTPHCVKGVDGYVYSDRYGAHQKRGEKVMQANRIWRYSGGAIIHVLIQGGGLPITGLAFNSSGMQISLTRVGLATATAFTAAGGTIENITTLGTFAAPTAGKIRFKEYDATNCPGVYEVHIATGNIPTSLPGANVVDTIRLGFINPTLIGAGDCIYAECSLEAIAPGTAAENNLRLLVDGTGYAGGTAKLGVNVVQVAGSAVSANAGTVDANVTRWGGANVAGLTGAGFPPVDVASIHGTVAPGADGILDVNTTQIAGIDAPAPHTYFARVHFQRNDVLGRDEYTVTWFKNAVPVVVTSPTIHVFDRNGADIIASTALTEIGSSTSWKLSSAAQVTSGVPAVAIVTAVIDSVTRTFSEIVGRDRASL